MVGNSRGNTLEKGKVGINKTKANEWRVTSTKKGRG